LNPSGWPFAEASAVSGIGVFDTLKRITKMVLEQTKRRTAVSPDGVPQMGDGVAAPALGGFTPPVPVGAETARQSDAAVPAGGSKEWSSASAVAVSQPKNNRHVEIGVAGDSGPIDGSSASRPMSPRGRVIMAAQPSLRIRTRQRSFWGRLLDWLSGR
jgi:hypothetical protein